MEIMLLGVTVISLLVAFITSAAAWRLSRDERARAAARVAALATAAREPETTGRVSMKAAPLVEPTAEPMAVGESRQAAPWASARVSTFAVPARASTLVEPQGRPSGSPTAVRPGTGDLLIRQPVAEEAPWTSTTLGEGFLGGAAASSPGSGRQRHLAVAAIFLFAAIIGGGYWTVYGDRSNGLGASARVADASPLELVSLRHERRGTRLAVTGLVRNPLAGSSIEKLAAVVFLFDQQGAFITSARADIDFLELAPGDESPFVISMDAPANVARYRVSFRNNAGIVPHIDRRGQEPIAPNAVSQNSTVR